MNPDIFIIGDSHTDAPSLPLPVDKLEVANAELNTRKTMG
jgi:hypothetical protein